MIIVLVGRKAHPILSLWLLKGILNAQPCLAGEALVAGERDFVQLQQKAIDAFGVPQLPKAVDRRQRIRLVSDTGDDRTAQ